MSRLNELQARDRKTGLSVKLQTLKVWPIDKKLYKWVYKRIQTRSINKRCQIYSKVNHWEKREHGKDNAFKDLEKAYDTINRRNKVRPKKNGTASDTAKAKVCWNDGWSVIIDVKRHEWFKTDRWVIQGSVLSPMLFNTAMVDNMRKVEELKTIYSLRRLCYDLGRENLKMKGSKWRRWNETEYE